MESLEGGFTLASIKDFLAYHGGKVEYHRLVTHFKHSLGSPEARVLFKDYVNELAFVAQEGNAKFLVLRPEYCHVDIKYERRIEFPSEASHDGHCVPSTSVNRHQVMTRSYSTQESRTSSIFCAATDDTSQPPQPPPRRKSLSSSSFAGSKSAGIEEKLRRLNETSSLKETEPKSPPHQEEKLKEIQELTFKSPGRVKEHAQKLNKMASELELRPPMPASDSQKKNKVKDSHRESKDEDNDSGSMQPLDPLRRKWMVIVSTCDYNEIVQLLKEDPKLAVFKDFTSGYTALHWAAKFGKAEIIKLIAGTHGVDPNVKNYAGQTPLHLAALFGHKHIIELLSQVYCANSNVRDHSGKLPQQYLQEKENVNNVEFRNKQNANGSVNGTQRKATTENGEFHSFDTQKSSSNTSALLLPTSSTTLTRTNRTRHHSFLGRTLPLYKRHKF